MGRIGEMVRMFEKKMFTITKRVECLIRQNGSNVGFWQNRSNESNDKMGPMLDFGKMRRMG